MGDRPRARVDGRPLLTPRGGVKRRNLSRPPAHGSWILFSAPMPIRKRRAVHRDVGDVHTIGRPAVLRPLQRTGPACIARYIRTVVYTRSRLSPVRTARTQAAGSGSHARGRPSSFTHNGGRVSPGRRRKNRLGSLTFTDVEWAYVKTAAARAGVRIAAFIRSAALDAAAFPNELRDVPREKPKR